MALCGTGHCEPCKVPYTTYTTSFITAVNLDHREAVSVSDWLSGDIFGYTAIWDSGLLIQIPSTIPILTLLNSSSILHLHIPFNPPTSLISSPRISQPIPCPPSPNHPHVPSHPPLRLRLPHRSILEVERKFAPTPLSISLLTHNAGSPAFTQHAPQRSLVSQDTYFDRDDELMRQGVYVRRRRYFDMDDVKSAVGELGQMGKVEKSGNREKSENWEAKIRVSGDFTRSAFQEVHGFDAVARLVRERFLHTNDNHSNHDCQRDLVSTAEDEDGFEFLHVLARFVTKRRQWLINERFHVVLDEADFGHVVGEVELAQESARAGVIAQGEGGRRAEGGCEGGGDAEGGGERDLAKELDKEIEEFMERYDWAFPRGEVKGKLSAYFEWRKQEDSS